MRRASRVNTASRAVTVAIAAVTGATVHRVAIVARVKTVATVRRALTANRVLKVPKPPTHRWPKARPSNNSSSNYFTFDSCLRPYIGRWRPI